MELLSSGTAYYLNGQNLYGLKSTPELGGTREKREVTNLLDTAHRYIAGLYKYDDLVFDFYYNSADANPNVTSSQTAAAFAAARAVERMDADGVMEFSIISIPNTPLTYSTDNSQTT